MKLDRQTAAFLAAGKDNPPLYELAVDAARAALTEISRVAGVPKVEVARFAQRKVPGPAGPVPVRLYWPRKGAAAKDLPILVFFHGGGFALGSAATHDDICRFLCANAKAIVVNVDYRRSPENKFPAAPEDCYAVLCWAAREAKKLGGNAERIAVAGDSAGGNLAAAVSLMARDRKGPELACQVLIYPVVEMDAAVDTPSRLRYGGGEYFLSRKDMAWLTGMYAAGKKDLKNPYLSPILAASLKDLPPALVITAGFDPLCDEGKLYADRLAKAGVATTYRNFAGTIHGFVSFGGVLDVGKQALALIGRHLAKHLGRTRAKSKIAPAKAAPKKRAVRARKTARRTK